MKYARKATFNHIFLADFIMKPKQSPSKDLSISMIEVELTSMISMKHELVTLAHTINWDKLEKNFGEYFSEKGRQAISTRLMIALHYLKYLNNLSDREVVAKWVENPYWQYFSGMKFFQHDFPINYSSMSRWRKRISQNGAEEIFKETIMAGLELKVVTLSDIKEINVDTTAQEKDIRYPTDSRLYQRSITNLVDYAKKNGLQLRQTYTRTTKKLLAQQQRYSHGRKYKQAQKCTKKLKTILGRIIREFDRKTEPLSSNGLKLLDICRKIYQQKRSDKNKIYSVHESDVSCIAKGKTHKKYEFGSKASIATTNKSNFIVGVLNFKDNLHDSKTLLPTLEKVKELGINVKNIFVDQGYKGHEVIDSKVHICKNQKKKSTKTLWKKIKRRAVIEPIIGPIHLSDQGM